MATLRAINNEPDSGASAAKVDMKFEVIVIPVADVDRSGKRPKKPPNWASCT